MNDSFDSLESELRQVQPRPVSERTLRDIERRTDGPAGVEPRRRSRARRPAAAWWAAGLGGAAVAVVLAVVLLRHPAPAPVSPAHPAPAVALSPPWRLRSTEGARYAVLSANRVRLDRGELFLNGVAEDDEPSNSQELTVETPDAQAWATATAFYVGAGPFPPVPDTKGTAEETLTRILIRAGTVTLANSSGSVTGGANDLLTAMPGQVPTRRAVRADGDVAFDLYRQMVKENPGANLLTSLRDIEGTAAQPPEPGPKPGEPTPAGQHEAGQRGIPTF